jgi:DNA polymerase III epsilon subunit-like protein
LFDEQFNFIDELYLYLKPPDGNYVVTAEGLRINKIDLVKHDLIAITYKEGATKLYDFIKKHSNDGKNRLYPVGQNVGFDIGHIHEKLLQKKNWDKFCSYRVRDTGVVGGFLQDVGYIDEAVSGGLSTLLDFFKIKYQKDQLHDAKVDAVCTLKLYEAMLKTQKEILKFWKDNRKPPTSI